MYFPVDIFLDPIPERFYYNINDTNSTIPNLNNSSSSQTQILIYSIVMPTLGLIAILMNLVVVISSGLILKTGQEPRSTYMFLGNVAMTDLITSFGIIFGQLLPHSMRDHYICSFQIGLIVSSTMTSIYSVGLIAIDRFLYIVHGLRYLKYITSTRTRCLITFSWFIGGLIGYLPLMGWNGDTDNGRVCWYIILAPKPLILLTTAVGVVPIIVVIVLYLIILYHALKNVNKIQSAGESGEITSPSNSSLRMFRGNSSISSLQELDRPIRIGKSPSKWKAIKVVLFTTGSFTITWLPYFVACTMYVYCGDRKLERCKSLSVLIASPLAILGFCNSLINPIIYAWWHKGFRRFTKNRISRILPKSESNVTSSRISNARRSDVF